MTTSLSHLHEEAAGVPVRLPAVHPLEELLEGDDAVAVQIQLLKLPLEDLLLSGSDELVGFHHLRVDRCESCKLIGIALLELSPLGSPSAGVVY